MHNFERRLRSFAIDTSFATILVVIAAFGLPFEPLVKGYIALGAYICVMFVPYLFGTGQSFGKRTQKMRIVNYKTQQTEGLIIILLREFFKDFLLISTLGIYGIIAGIVTTNRRDGRSIHDLIFGTQVICLTKYIDGKEELIKDRSGSAERNLRGMGPHD